MKPKAITQERVNELLPELKNGSYPARDELIEGHIRLVLGISNQFAKKFPALKEDIESKSYDVLVDKLEKLRSGKNTIEHTNLGGFINKCIVGELRRFTKKEVEIFKKNREFEVDIESADTTFNRLVEDIQNDVVFTETEKILLTMRIQGYTDSEIGEKLGVTQQRVWLVRRTEAFRKKVEKYLCISQQGL